ncbi:MAG: proteasome subunit beta [Thermoprotei archaeon]
MLNVRKGTTTVGIKCRDGVVLAADKRATAGYAVANKEVVKIAKVTDFCAGTIAGTVSEAFEIMHTLRAEAALYAVRTERPISVKGIASLASEILNSQKFYSLPVQLILGGYDTEPRLFMIDFFGSLSEESFIASGSGSPVAVGVLRNAYTDTLDVQKGVELAAQAVNAAIGWDPASGEGITLVTVDSSGAKYLPYSGAPPRPKRLPE